VDGVGAAASLAGLDLDGQEAIRGVKDQIDLAPRVSAEEVKGRFRPPRRPVEYLVEGVPLAGQEARECRVRPVQLGPHEPGDDGRQERAQEGHLVRDFQGADVPLDRVDGDVEFAGDVGVGKLHGIEQIARYCSETARFPGRFA
jgi:hypothetical protein